MARGVTGCDSLGAMPARPKSPLVIVPSIALSFALACGPTPPAPASPTPSSSGPEAAKARTDPPAPDDPVDVSSPRVATSAPPPIVPQPSQPSPPLDPPCKNGKRAALEDDATPIWELAATAPERGVLGLPGRVLAHIPPEVVQRPIRERFACLRGCYQEGLARKPDLHGRVVVGFTIEAASGKVKSVSDQGSTLPDRAVIACVLEEMKLVRFPAPGAKDVHIVYPLGFLPPR